MPTQYAEMPLAFHNDMFIILSGNVHIQKINQIKKTKYAIGSYKNKKDKLEEGGEASEDMSSVDSFHSDTDDDNSGVYLNAI